jgi:hypothetical protein
MKQETITINLPNGVSRKDVFRNAAIASGWTPEVLVEELKHVTVESEAALEKWLVDNAYNEVTREITNGQVDFWQVSDDGRIVIAYISRQVVKNPSMEEFGRAIYVKRLNEFGKQDAVTAASHIQQQEIDAKSQEVKEIQKEAAARMAKLPELTVK